jgi:hypothetical protein
MADPLGEFVSFEDFISTYPEAQKVIDEFLSKLKPVKDFLINTKLPNGEPLIQQTTITVIGKTEVNISLSFKLGDGN